MRPRRESQRDRLARERREEIAYVLASEAGRRFAWRLLCETGAIATSKTSDPSQALFAEGRRSVGAEVLAAVLTQGRPALALLLAENLSAERRDEPAREADADDEADPAGEYPDELPEGRNPSQDET